MEFLSSHLPARILITIATVGYGIATVFVDFNKTHATNPAWTPHARFHVVWQIASYFGIAIIVLGLTWLPGPSETGRLYLAGALGVVILASFYVAMLARSLYGGALKDENGVPPFKPPFGPAHWRWDVNATGFTVFSVIQFGRHRGDLTCGALVSPADCPGSSGRGRLFV